MCPGCGFRHPVFMHRGARTKLLLAQRARRVKSSLPYLIVHRGIQRIGGLFLYLVFEGRRLFPYPALEGKQCDDIWQYHQCVDEVGAFPYDVQWDYGAYVNHYDVEQAVYAQVMFSP